MSSFWTRFDAEETGDIHLAQIDAKQYLDVGLVTVEGKKIRAKEITGSPFDGVVTNRELTDRDSKFHPWLKLISPVSKEPAKIACCLLLNIEMWYCSKLICSMPQRPIWQFPRSAFYSLNQEPQLLIPILEKSSFQSRSRRIKWLWRRIDGCNMYNWKGYQRRKFMRLYSRIRLELVLEFESLENLKLFERWRSRVHIEGIGTYASSSLQN